MKPKGNAMWATKKQLRRDAELFKEENEALKAEIKALTTGIDELKTELNESLSIEKSNAKEVATLRATVEKLKKQMATQNETIRKQTEADLLVNALQAVGIIPKPQNSENVDHFSNAERLQSRLFEMSRQEQQQAYESGTARSGLASALNRFGLAGGFR